MQAWVFDTTYGWIGLIKAGEDEACRLAEKYPEGIYFLAELIPVDL